MASFTITYDLLVKDRWSVGSITPLYKTTPYHKVQSIQRLTLLQLFNFAQFDELVVGWYDSGLTQRNRPQLRCLLKDLSSHKEA